MPRDWQWIGYCLNERPESAQEAETGEHPEKLEPIPREEYLTGGPRNDSPLDTIRCSHCGYEHPASWRFCDKTGMALEPRQRNNSFRSVLLYCTGLAIIVAATWLLRPVIWPNPQPAEPSKTASVEPTSDNTTPSPGYAEENGFQLISLEPFANYPMDHLLSPLSGNMEFTGIPFSILSEPMAIFQSQNIALPKNPIRAVLVVSVPNAKSVYILMGGAYISKSLNGQQVGNIVLGFDNGETFTKDLIAGQNIRENWGYLSPPENPADDQDITSMDASNASADWQNVYYENQIRGGKAALGYVDMLTIPVPDNDRKSTLTAITINDTVYDPSILIYAITISTFK